MAIVPFFKNYTETLACMMERFRTTYPKYKTSKITYAGRLDPLAEGLVIVLTDEDVLQKDTFLQKEKRYRVEYCFGIETDSYDILGRISHFSNAEPSLPLDTKEQLYRFLAEVNEQVYPIFSSRPVNGKPLWYWGLHHPEILASLEIPKHSAQVYIDSFQEGETRTLSLSDFSRQVDFVIEHVQGNFRQEDIRKDWQDSFNHSQRDSFQIFSFEVSVSSGTYIRSLVHDFGKKIGCGAVCIRIQRLGLGEYTLKDIDR